MSNILVILCFLTAILSTKSIDLTFYEVLTVDNQIPSTTIQIAQNALFALKVISNPTTGYQWQVKEGKSLFAASNVLAAVNIDETTGQGEYESDPNPSNLAGLGGNSYFKFKATNVGEQAFTLVYKRSWETNPINSIQVKVQVIRPNDSL